MRAYVRTPPDLPPHAADGSDLVWHDARVLLFGRLLGALPGEEVYSDDAFTVVGAATEHLKRARGAPPARLLRARARSLGASPAGVCRHAARAGQSARQRRTDGRSARARGGGGARSRGAGAARGGALGGAGQSHDGARAEPAAPAALQRPQVRGAFAPPRLLPLLLPPPRLLLLPLPLLLPPRAAASVTPPPPPRAGLRPAALRAGGGVRRPRAQVPRAPNRGL